MKTTIIKIIIFRLIFLSMPVSGQTFIPFTNNPVVDTLNTLNSSEYWTRWKTDPCVIHWNNDSLRMYYGTNNYGVKTQIGTAVSPDGNNWIEKRDAPVVSLGPTGSWDDTDVETPFVVYVPSNPDSTKYMLWYSGATKDTNLLDTICGVGFQNEIYQMGMAYSNDGLNWTKYNNTTNDSLPLYAESDPVISIPYVSGCQPSVIGYESFAIAEPCVIYDSIVQKYKMWYIGVGCSNPTCSGPNDYRHRILYSESTNGINWITGIPVLDIGGISDFDSKVVYAPDVVKIGNEYWMFYSGENTGFPVMGAFTLWHQRIGIAKSNDGIFFVKGTLNPIIPNGTFGSWNEFGSNFSSAIVYHDTLRVYYSGVNDTIFGFLPKIGYSFMDSVLSNITSHVDNNYELAVYPNPTTGKIFIDSKGIIISIEIYNALGKKIFATTNLKKQLSNEINLFNSPKGIYLVRIYDGEKIYTEKIMVQ